ncbi:MAG: aspartate 1-decarboxylase [Sphingomonas sp.]
MRISLLKCKLHRCTVTHADLSYEGSITISEELAEAAGLLEYEQVHVWNVTAGSRFVTYVMIGPRDSRVICVNGAAARLVAKGDILIVARLRGGRFGGKRRMAAAARVRRRRQSR